MRKKNLRNLAFYDILLVGSTLGMLVCSENQTKAGSSAAQWIGSSTGKGAIAGATVGTAAVIAGGGSIFLAASAAADAGVSLGTYLTGLAGALPALLFSARNIPISTTRATPEGLSQLGSPSLATSPILASTMGPHKTSHKGV